MGDGITRGSTLGAFIRGGIDMKKQYKVWIHIECVNDEGDPVEGDGVHEPREAGSFDTLGQAQDLRDKLLEDAGS